jgi:hypothetical protein
MLLSIACTQVHGCFFQPKLPSGRIWEAYDLQCFWQLRDLWPIVFLTTFWQHNSLHTCTHPILVSVIMVCVLFPLEKSLDFISVWSILFRLNVLTLHHIHTGSWFFSLNRNVFTGDSTRLMTYSVSDIIVTFTPAPTPCSHFSISHTHIIHTPSLPTPTILTITWTQVLWFLVCLTRPPVSCCVTTTRLTVCFTHTTRVVGQRDTQRHPTLSTWKSELF